MFKAIASLGCGLGGAILGLHAAAIIGIPMLIGSAVVGTISAISMYAGLANEGKHNG